MPRRKAGREELHKIKKRTLRNKSITQDIKKVLKSFKALLAKKDINTLKTLLPQIMSKLDKAVKKGILHRNAARRKISRLSLKIKSLA